MEIGEGKTRTINIDLKGKFPLVIGRGNSADIRIGLLGKKTFVKDVRGELVPIANCISSVHATLRKYEDGRIVIYNGNGRPSSSGVYIFGHDKPIERPVTLGPGAHIELMRRTGDYYCWIEWEEDEESATSVSEPTHGFNNWRDKVVLEVEKLDLKDEVSALNKKLEERIQRDLIQDKRIDKLKKRSDRIFYLGIVTVAAAVIGLGINVEQVESIAAIVALAAGGGMAYTATSKQ